MSIASFVISAKGKQIDHTHIWINDIDYYGFKLNWFECVEKIDSTTTRFVYISSVAINYHILKFNR